MKDTKTRLESYQPLWSNWYLDESINSGSSGQVYKFKQKDYEIYSAVKVITMLLEKEPGINLDTRLKSLSAKRVRAENEIRAMYHLESCPYTVHCRNHDIKDILDDRGRVVGFDVLIQMNFYTCLQKKILDGNLPLSENEIIKIGTQVGEGVRAAHALDIIHRDIKPENIFINENNDYILGDFGISKQVRSGYYSTIAGTYAYMAPEVYKASSEKKYEKTADIYSLGIVMYILLNNNYSPFTNEKSSQNEIDEMENKRLNGEIELPPLEHISDRLNRILLKCCRSKPAERYQSIEEFLADLAAVNNQSQKPANARIVMPAAAISPKPIADSDMYRTVVADKTEQTNTVTEKPSAAAIPDSYKTVYADTSVDEELPAIGKSSVSEQQKKRKSPAGIIAGVSLVVAAAAIIVTSAVALNGKIDKNMIDSIAETAEIPSTESEAAYEPLDENQATDFVYEYNERYSGIEITEYIGVSDKVRIPAEIDGKKVVYLHCQFPERITRVELPDTLTQIGYCAFKNCKGISSITIPDSVTNIYALAFEGCTGLKSITIPNGITEIIGNTFLGCTGLKSITIPDSVTTIDEFGFMGLSGLNGITIPDSVTSIGSSAFAGCSNLELVTLSNSIAKIDIRAFEDCTSLTSLTIPDSVSSIGMLAFNGCTELTNIIIPDSVTEIGSMAFRDCTSLTNVTMSRKTSVADNAFYGCDKLVITYID